MVCQFYKFSLQIKEEIIRSRDYLLRLYFGISRNILVKPKFYSEEPTAAEVSLDACKPQMLLFVVFMLSVVPRLCYMVCGAFMLRKTNDR